MDTLRVSEVLIIYAAILIIIMIVQSIVFRNLLVGHDYQSALQGMALIDVVDDGL
jgi:hypothetical protein